MTALTAIVQIALLFSPGNSDRTSNPGYAIHPSVVQSQTQSQSAELAEAAKITSSVLKLYQERKYGEALPLAKRAVQLRGAALGADDPLLRNALLNLAEIYIALEKFGDAESPLERVVKSYEKIDPRNPLFANVLGRFALVHYVRGNFSRSEEAYQQALEVTEKAFGPDSSQTAQAVFSLAEFYQVRRNYKKGEPLYQRLVSIREKGSGPKQREQLAIAVDRYACLLRKTDRAADAKELEDRTLDPLRQLAQENDAATLANVLNGKAINMPKPSYPADAIAASVTGKVTVRVVIDETGNVVRACALSGPPLLVRESELAAFRAKFTSTKLNGVPIKVLGVIVYKFSKQ